jgi:hypothetical protein
MRRNTRPSRARRPFLLRSPDAAYPFGRILSQPALLSFTCVLRGVTTTSAARNAHGFAAIPLVTIGVTNADATSNSAVDDGAADHGMDCT